MSETPERYAEFIGVEGLHFELLERAQPNTVGVVCAKYSFWVLLVKRLSDDGLVRHYSPANYRLTLTNGAVVRFTSRPEGALGLRVDYCLVDHTVPDRQSLLTALR